MAVKCEPEVFVAHVEAFTDWLATLTDEERELAFVRLFRHFCQHCGSSHLPCYCMRDD